MGKEHKGTGWVLGGWSVAALFSVSTAVLLIVVGHWSFIQALFFGGVLFALAGLVINFIWRLLLRLDGVDDFVATEVVSDLTLERRTVAVIFFNTDLQARTRCAKRLVEIPKGILYSSAIKENWR